jgi:Mce-associated membrane protein
VLETATGEFAADYRRTTEQLRPTFTASKAVAVGEVVAAGIETAQIRGAGLAGDGPERVVVVLAVDQVISTSGAPARTERNRIRMILVRPDDTWLVEQVQRL